jgi:hypothetical protein
MMAQETSPQRVVATRTVRPLKALQVLTLDHVDIRDINITPTGDELMATREAYVPANIPGAPHHLPDDSMART